MSQLVKTKRQANFKGFKRFGAFKGLVEQKNLVFNSFVCKLDLFWHSWAFTRRQKRQHRPQKRIGLVDCAYQPMLPNLLTLNLLKLGN
jgi:hypothetical protein